MARIRTIKPEFFTSLTIADLAFTTRLTFIGLWTHVDDYGRCVDDARLIKAAVWPLDDRVAADVEADLAELAEAGLIHRYTVGRRRYLLVTGWDEHQKVSHPAKSKIPQPAAAVDGPPPGNGHRPAPPENLQNPPENLARIPEDPPRTAGPQPPPTPSEPALISVNTRPHDPPEILRKAPENLQNPPEVLRSDQGSGNREQGSSSARLHAYVATATGADDDETRTLIDEIQRRHRPRNIAGYVRTMAGSGDLAALLDEVRCTRVRQLAGAARRAQLAAIDTAPPPAAPMPAAEARAAARAVAEARRQRADHGHPGAAIAALRAVTTAAPELTAEVA